MTDKRQSALRKSLPVMPSVWLLSLCCFCSEVSSGTSFSYVSSSSEDHKLFFYCVDSHSPPRSTLITTKLSPYDSERDFDATIIRGPLRVFTVHCASLKSRASLSVLLKMPFQPVIAEWLVSCAGALSVGARALTCWLAAAADACISTQWYDGHWHLS